MGFGEPCCWSQVWASCVLGVSIRMLLTSLLAVVMCVVAIILDSCSEEKEEEEEEEEKMERSMKVDKNN